MKTLKLILGIISFILSAFVLFQSCAAGIGNAIENNGEAGGSAGVILAICCIVAGIVAISALPAREAMVTLLYGVFCV